MSKDSEKPIIPTSLITPPTGTYIQNSDSSINYKPTTSSEIRKEKK